MLLIVNGNEKHYGEEIRTLADLVETFNVKHRFFAVMLNTEIISKKDFSSTNLKNNDAVNIVHMVGGG